MLKSVGGFEGRRLKVLRVHGWAIGHEDIMFAECVSGGDFRSW